MSDPIRPHWSFWLIAALGLIWHALGTLNLIMQMNPETLAEMPETHRAIVEARPGWVTLAFAVAVIGGTLGCLLLLLRKSLAMPVLILSLAGATLTTAHALFLTKGPLGFTAFEIALAIIGPVAVGVFLVWYAAHAKRRGWIA